MDRRWRAPLLGGALWLLSIPSTLLLERAHWGTEHTGLLLIGLGSGLFTGSVFGAVIPWEQRGYLRVAITLLLVMSVGGVQRFLAAHDDLDLMQPTMFGSAACGMALALWYRARVAEPEDGDTPGAQSPDQQCGRR